MDKIEEFLNDMTRFPDAIAISETKLNSNSSSNNNIPHYNFRHNNSPTNAGGAGVYIKDTLICQIVRTYRYKLNAKCPILFLQ